ncbi:hypothetical protein Q8W71_08915 [Methylobacterium sp. NEAU 140]|uniref:hypothetical protein n=1 Tax=Methylobacterium sp. NEAU 140 TaxID=3064945 RepID=UPI002736D164|nr:hypothetical protein [Methylobacterium sp. NEAU 140]MDP4022742.1 hypothetical protein [Methylobacterium sp. NEAU 140]
MGADHGSDRAFLAAVLARMTRAEHRLVAAFITDLTGGGYTFAEARALWTRTWIAGAASDWTDPAAFLRFLLTVRDTIDPHAWPATAPRFRPGPAEKARRR